MQIRPVSDMWVSACQVGSGPLLTSVNTNSGSAATRHSHANRSNIGTSTCAPEQEIAGRKTERRDHQDGEGADAEIVTDGAADHQQADGGDADADALPRARPLAEQQRRKADGEQRLALHDHAGKPDRNAMRNGKGLRQKLAEEQREGDRGQYAP